MTKTVAIIPVKSISERVPNKNFRPFTPSGQSLFDLTVDKLLATSVDDIYVSTNY